MNEASEARRTGRTDDAEPAGARRGPSRAFALAAHDDKLVLVDTAGGRSWALAHHGGGLVWHPIASGGPAGKVPGVAGRSRRHLVEDAATSTGKPGLAAG